MNRQAAKIAKETVSLLGFRFAATPVEFTAAPRSRCTLVENLNFLASLAYFYSCVHPLRGS
jgi:hypothetical protein